MIVGNQRLNAFVVPALFLARSLRPLFARAFRVALAYLVLFSAVAHAVQVRVASYDIGQGFPTVGSPQFEAIKSTLTRINSDVVAFQGLTPATAGDWEAMATQAGYSHIAISEASNLLQQPQLVGVMSRFPILESKSLSSPASANELFCRPLRVVVDVPGAAKPLALWNVQHRAGSSTTNAEFVFSRSVEAIRVLNDIDDYLLDNPYHTEFLVLGNFNEDPLLNQPVDAGTWPPVSFLPPAYVLGSDIVPFNLAYSKFPDDRYAAAGGGLTRLPALQQDGLTRATLLLEARAVDHLLLSGDLTATAVGEVYSSASDVATGGAGRPKTGDIPPANTSATAGPHFPVFADLQLEDEAPPVFSLAPAEDFSATLSPGPTAALPTKAYVIANLGGERLDWEVQVDQPWISVNQASGQLDSGADAEIIIALNEQAKTLKPGKYSGLVTFKDGASGRYFVRTVRLLVEQPALLVVSPAAGINSFGDPGGPFAPSTVTYTLRNAGVEPLVWSLNIPVAWLSATTNAGTLEPGGEVTVGVSLTTAAESLAAGPYDVQINFVNETNGLGSTVRPFRLRVGERDFLTEFFAPGSFDLVNRSITFTPSGSGYRVCLGAATQFPTDPQGGTVLNIVLDTYQPVQIAAGQRFPFFGTNYTSFNVAGHGHLTFGPVGDGAEYTRSLANHFAYRRISAFFADMDPSQRGRVSWRQLADRVAVTYQDVPEFSFGGANNFQVELFFDGRIRITYLSLTATPRDIIVGLSPGGGVPPNFLNSKLSSNLPCSSAGTFVPASLRAADFLPAVPGSGLGTEVFNRLGGGAVPSPVLLAGREADATMRVPLVDFPRPGQTAQIGGSFATFFADTIKPPVSVGNLAAENFILRFQGFLKIDNSVDVDPFTPGIQVSLGVGSDDGYYLLIGDLVLGSSGDRDFSSSPHDLTFEAAGLYPLTLLYSRSLSGPSGVELTWSRGTPTVTEIIPQSYLYRAVTTANRKVDFDDLSEGTSPAESYRNLGVEFTTSPGVVATQSVSDYVPVTAPLVLGNPAGSGTVSMRFIDPATGESAVTDFFSLYVINTIGAGAEVTAYDPADQVIFSRVVNDGGRSQTAVSFSHPYIARVQVTLGEGSEGSALDQLTFRAPRMVKPVLSLILGSEPVLEGGDLTGTVTLTESWYEDLVVSFTTSPPDRLGNFAPVVIPAGEKSLAFTLPVARDGVQSSPINVSLKASAGGSEEVSASFTVLDIDRPDLTVQNARLEPEGQLLSGGEFTVLWSVANVGLYPVAERFNDRVLVRNLTTGQTISDQTVPYDPATGGNGAIGSGETRARQVSVRLPDGPDGVGDLSVEITTDASNLIAEYAPGYDAEANNSAQATSSAVLAPYPDLQVASLAILPAAGLSGIQAAGGVVVNWTLSNNGNGIVQSAFADRLIVRNKATGQVLFDRMLAYDPSQPGAGVIEPGQTKARTDELVLPSGLSAVGDLEFEVATNAGASPFYEYNVDGTALSNNAATEIVASTQERQGPTLSNIRFNSQSFTDGLAVTGSGVVSLNASDASGVGRIDFFARRVAGGGETLFGSSTAPPYSVSWNAESTESDGLYAIIIRVYDTYGNLTESAQNLNLTLAVPPSPTITAPADGAILSRSNVTVTGLAQAGRAVTVFVNGAADPAPAPADASGNFAKPLVLADGTNLIEAAVSNRAGSSERASVSVEVDRSVPPPPTAVTAQSLPGGSIRLAWARPAGAIEGYRIYRSSAPFEDPATAESVSESLVTSTTFDDTPPEGGTYFYRIVALNTAQTAGQASAQVSAESDGDAPTATLEYTPRGAYDAGTEQFGTGLVDVTLTVSEPLSVIPFLSLSPTGGTPIVIDLRRVSPTVFTGNFLISSATPSGPAVASFSARDGVGNRGTVVTAGGSIVVDTAGPKVASLDIQPSRSVRNDETNPVTVVFTARLDSAPKPGTAPQFSYKLSQSQPAEVVITNVSSGADPLVYTIVQQLPAGAGATPESLQLLFNAVDTLGNEGTVIDGQSSFQVYQNDLPGLEAPVGLTAKGEPAGEILLAWNAVEGAARYRVFRRVAGVGEFAAVTSVEATTYTDLPLADGTYEYRVAAVREENGQTSVGEAGATATALSDRVPPSPASGLQLKIVSQGVQAEWDHSPSVITESLSYSLYRTADLPAEPQLAGAGIPSTFAIDAAPDPQRPNYFVVAVDSVGNQSSPTTWAYLNIDLLPVRTLTITRTDDEPPVIGWSQVSLDMAGYDIYWKRGETKTKLNAGGLLPAGTTSFTDSGYSSSADRTYEVVTIDGNGRESEGRSLTLPRVSFSLPADTTVARGAFNRLVYTVRNDSAAPIEKAKLIVLLGGREHASKLFSIDAGATKEIPVVVGGYDELTGDSAPLETRLLLTTDFAGEQVFIIRNTSVLLTSAGLGVDLMPGEFTTGGSGSARFTLTNTSTEKIQILSSGPRAEDSPEVRMTLLDGEGNVLATQPLKITTGAEVVLQPDGSTVVQLAPGQSYTSPPMVLQVPSNAPTRMFLRFEIDKVYYNRGEQTEVVLDGLQTRREVSTVQTSYFASVNSITPAESNGDVPVVISGTATARVGGPMPNARLKLFIVRDGFESVREVFTDSSGTFSFSYVPAANEAGGIYEVRAVHPDITDRTPQASFVIRRVTVTPLDARLRSVKNYVQPINVTARTGEGVTVNNLRLEYVAADQDGGVAIPGITVAPAPAVASVGPGQTARLDANITASIDAPSSGVLILRVASNESGASGWQKVRINYEFGPPAALLSASPSVVNTGVHPEDPAQAVNGVVEEVIFTNNGLVAAEDLRFSLLRQNGGVAPGWAGLIVDAGASLDVGQKRTVSLSFQPPANEPPGYHVFLLRAEAAGGVRTDVPVSVAVTPSGKGNVEFRVINPFTEFDSNGNVTVSLAGASVQVQNEDVPSVEQTVTTDNLGTAFFADLPAGSYKFRVNANKHITSSGRFWIRPGATVSRTVQLQYNPVTIEWSVVPITIQDRYDVVLEAVFETDVPVPVVVIEPSGINLPPMCRGDVINGEFTITNKGLIRADNLKIPFPESDEFIKVELPAEIPTSLGAKQTIRIPYRVTALQDVGGDCAASQPEPLLRVSNKQTAKSGSKNTLSGGTDNCIGVRCAPVTYTYVCSNGTSFEAAGLVCWFYTYKGDCKGAGGGGGGGGGGLVFGPGGGGGGGGGGAIGPISPLPTSDVVCWPVNVRYGWPQGPIGKLWEGFKTWVGCSVNTLTRKFEEDVTDLSVRIPGRLTESVQVSRRYRDGEWRFFEKIEFEPAERGGPYSALYWQNYLFSPDSDASVENFQRFRSGDMTITVDQSSAAARFRLTSGNNSWAVFDEDGHMRSFGRNNETYASMTYGTNGKMATVLAGSGPQVLLTYHWDADGRLDYVEDHTGRRVDYTWRAIANGAVDLHKVVGPDGSETNYQYEGYARPLASGGTEPAARITKVTDSTGKSHLIAYSTELAVKSVLDEQGRGETFEFNFNDQTKVTYGAVRSTSGKVDEKWFALGGELIEWRINGLVVRKVDIDGRTRITTDADGYRWTEKRDERGRTLEMINPDGTSRRFEYDPANGRLIRSWNERGIVSALQYDSRENLSAISQAVGTTDETTTVLDFGSDDKIRSLRMPGDGPQGGARIDVTYDARGDVSQVSGPIPGSATQVLERDTLGNVTSSRDALGQSWDVRYDVLGRPVVVTDPRPGGKKTTFKFDAFNNVTEVTSPSQRTFRFDYDINNSLVASVDPAGEIANNVFDSGGRLTKSIDATGREISYEYDQFDRTVKTRDQEGNEVVYTYAPDSASSRPVSIKFPAFTRTISYNFRNQPVSTTDTFASGSALTTKYTYYPTGELETVEDPAGRVTRYSLDNLGRVTEISSPGLGNTRQINRLAYDMGGNVRAFTNPNGQVWNYEYDAAGQLTAEITPLGHTTRFSYDAAGNLESVTRPDGSRIERDFDGLGNVVRATQYARASSGGHITKRVEYTRGDDARLIGYNEFDNEFGIASSSALYDYDAAGRLKSETVSITKTDGTTLASTVSYAYYANGLLQSYTSPSGAVTTYTYDQAGRLIATSVDGVGQFLVNGYQFGAMTGMTLPGGGTKSFEYDGYQRPTRLVARDPSGQTVSDFAVLRDNVGNVISRNTGQGAAGFTYDPANRLVAGQSGSYTYDGNGNRLTYSGTGSDIWRYDSDDRLLTDGRNSYEYDANGSLVRKVTPQGEWTFSYDHDGRLVQVIRPGSPAIEYRYDPSGRRIAKIIGGIATYYRYSAFGLCAEYDNSGKLIREYGYSANAGNGTAPLYVKEGGRCYFYHTDHLGTPWKLTSEAGEVVWAANYDDFGKAHITTAVIENNWRFPGHFYDEETGLHYNVHRYYSPSTGRYISRDGANDGTNYYTYADSNPLAFTDPNGLRTWESIDGAIRKITDVACRSFLLPKVLAALDMFDAITSGDLNGFAKAYSAQIMSAFIPGVNFSQTNRQIYPVDESLAETERFFYSSGESASSIVSKPYEDLKSQNKFQFGDRIYKDTYYGNQYQTATDIAAAKARRDSFARLGRSLGRAVLFLESAMIGADLGSNGFAPQAVVENVVSFGSLFLGPKVALGVGIYDYFGGFDCIYELFSNEPLLGAAANN